MKKSSLIFIFIFSVFVLANLVLVSPVWAIKYRCECTSAAPTQIYDVGSYEECKVQCNTYCLANGGMNKCTEIQENNDDQEQGTNELDNPIKTKSISTLIGRIIKAFLGIIGTISLVVFIYAGIVLLTSAGTPGKIQTGQKTMVWASLGILVVFASYAILKFVFTAFGL